MVISPAAVADVSVMFNPEVTAAAIVTVRPAVSVIAPKPELTLELIVTSLLAPVDVKDIVPLLPALTAPLTATDPKEATSVILPKALVVIPAVVKFPVAAVNEKLALLSTMLVKAMAVVVGVTV